MSPHKVSAQFAAFVWYSNQHDDRAQAEATKFARENWPEFLPLAHEGVGRLLLKIATPRAAQRTRRHQTSVFARAG